MSSWLADALPVLLLAAWTSLASAAASASPQDDGPPPQPPGSPQAARSTLDGVFTPGQASRGQRRFDQVCATCHQLSEHTGRRFAVKWEGTSVGDLFDIIATTMPEANPGELPPAEYADIVAFLLRENGYPSGSEELPAELAALSKVRIEPLPR